MPQAYEPGQVIQALQALAVELGRTPKITEVLGGDKVITRTAMRQLFGTYTVLVKAAGMTPYFERGEKYKKIDNSIFEKDLPAHLAEYKPRDLISREPYARCLFIPDVHFPFEHKPTLEAIYRFAEKEQPAYVIQIGDLRDRYSHSRFPRSHNIFTPEQEDDVSGKAASLMWEEIAKACPGAKRIQMLGNHDVRPMKQALAQYPQAEKWIREGLEREMTFPGVQTIYDIREPLMLPGGVAVVHGHLSQLGAHRDEFLMNVVHGHRHLGGVVYRNFNGRTLWELDCGFAGDPESKGLSYTPTKLTKWTHGWGWLDEYGARFIAL